MPGSDELIKEAQKSGGWLIFWKARWMVTKLFAFPNTHKYSSARHGTRATVVRIQRLWGVRKKLGGQSFSIQLTEEDENLCVRLHVCVNETEP